MENKQFDNKLVRDTSWIKHSPGVCDKKIILIKNKIFSNVIIEI